MPNTSPIAQDTIKNAVKTLSELTRAYPEKTRKQLLEKVILQYDLSPVEAEFLTRHFSSSSIE